MGACSVILFHTPNSAVWTSSVLERNHIIHSVVSVPKGISANCGYCVRFNTVDTEAVNALLVDTEIEFDRIIML